MESGEIGRKDAAATETAAGGHCGAGTNGMDGEAWQGLVEAVERPASILEGPVAGDVEGLAEALSANGLFPLAYHAWQGAGVLPKLPEDQRALLRDRYVRYLAGWMAAWEETGRILDVWLAAGLTPILLKGADLAVRYYAEPHLRPMSDLDVLFPSTAECERAYDLLTQQGFRTHESLPQEPWALLQHLPALSAPVTGWAVEIHGALLLSPRDSRWTGGGVRLIEERRSYSWQGRRVEGLAPEALAVFLCGHMWFQHAGDEPRAMVLYDLKAILDREGSAFRWPLLLELAEAAGVTGAVGRGFGLLDALLGVAPEPVVRKEIQARGREAELALSPGGAAVEQLVGRLRHEGLGAAVRTAWRIAFPPFGYMRWRYRDKRKWPVGALYPYRWAGQAARIVRWAMERARLAVGGRR